MPQIIFDLYSKYAQTKIEYQYFCNILVGFSI